MSAPTPAAGAAATTTTELDGAQWLDKALDTARVDKEDTAARRRGSEALDQFIAQAVKPGQVVSKDVETNIKFWIAEIEYFTFETRPLVLPIARVAACRAAVRDWLRNEGDTLKAAA